MIVKLSRDAPPVLTDVDRFDRLHAVRTGPLEEMHFDAMCHRCDRDHIWLSILSLRVEAKARSHDPEFGAKFDAMIEHAASQGWLDEDGTHVRAHLEVAQEST